MAYVAGAEPVAEEGRSGLVGILPVAPADLRAAQANLPVLAGRKAVAAIVPDFDLDMGNGPSRRSDLFDLASGLHERIATDGFGQAVSVDVACRLKKSEKARMRPSGVFSPPPIAHFRLETS